jgi:hypothetical protein
MGLAQKPYENTGLGCDRRLANCVLNSLRVVGAFGSLKDFDANYIAV